MYQVQKRWMSDLSELGQTRYWYWRGWRIRYTFLLPEDAAARQASPLLLLHGFGASLQQWRSNLTALAQQRPVYCLDLLGFGDSQKAATTFNTNLWSDQVYDFWQQWMGRPMVLVGHSLGALVALNTAIAHTDAIDRLVMLTLPAAREELLSGWVEMISRWVEQAFSTPLLIRPLFQLVRQPWVLRGALRSVYQVPERVDADLLAQFVTPTRDRGAARTLCYLVRSRTEPQFTPETQLLIPQLTVPTLLLWGQRDQVIPIAWGRRVAPLNPRVTLVEVPQAGHCLYDEYPEAVNQHLLTWLSGLS